MSNKIECKRQLKRYLIARIPLIVVNTIERSRILGLLQDIAEEMVKDTLTKAVFRPYLFPRDLRYPHR